MDIGLRYGPLCDCALVGRRLAVRAVWCWARLTISIASVFRRHRQSCSITRQWLTRTISARTMRGIFARMAWKHQFPYRVACAERERSRADGRPRRPRLHSRLSVDVAPELASGAIRAVITEWTLPDIELWVVFPMGRMTNAKARAFATFVERAVGPLVQTRSATTATQGRIPKSRRPFGDHRDRKIALSDYDIPPTPSDRP